MPVKILVSGLRDEVKAVYNALNASPDCLKIKSHPAHVRKNLEDVSQTIEAEFKAAKRYAERKEKPIRDRSGWVYLCETPYIPDPPYVGIFKLGHAVDVSNRQALFRLKLPFAVKLVHNFYCSDRYAVERELKRRYRKQLKVINKTEFVQLTEDDLADIGEMGA